MRSIAVATFCAVFAVVPLAAQPVKPAGLLRVDRVTFPPARTAGPPRAFFPQPVTLSLPSTRLAANAAPMPTFGHPVISGIGGTGFEQNLRLDPTNPNRIYTSVPGTASANTSWIWHSEDGGKTFKWVVGAAALEGKVTTCNGGGDTELAVDSKGRLYFNDLTLVNFSTARSDDGGKTFICSNTGVPDTLVDRQWYAVDGDPLDGGSIYLTNDEIGPGGVNCPNSLPPNNVLVIYRSPVLGLGATAGIEFGPPQRITSPGSCDQAIMGNIEVSPVATNLGQPNGTGGFATLANPVKHVYVIHDDANLHQIRIGRCFPVAFGPPVANVSDPTGLNCTDILVRELGPNVRTGANFPTMAIDNAGNLYVVWEQAPITGGSPVDGWPITGDVVLMYTYSTDQGNTWADPIQIDTSGSPVGTLRTNVFAWMTAGDDGRIAIAWYGTPGAAANGAHGPDDCNDCIWYLWVVQSLNAHDAVPTFTPPIMASQHHVHRGNVQTIIGGQNQLSSRALGDFLQIRTGPLGEVQIAYVDTNNIIGAAVGHGMYVRQNGGSGLLAAQPLVSVPGIAPYNAVTDPSGDGKYEANGASSASMPNLDIIGSRIAKVTTAPCTVADPCYEIVMELNNLSFLPDVNVNPDLDLVWSTQWLIPSTTDANGGKNFHVYAESFNGEALECFVGENAVMLVGGGAQLTYPGTTQLAAANCKSTSGPGGTITMYVPLSMVSVPGAIDEQLHEVTASTMTLQQRANTSPSFGGIGGSLFNLIDVAQPYLWTPIVLPPAPTITSVDPGPACQGGPAFTMTVTGTGFTPTSVVQVNGADRATTFVSATQLTASVLSDDTRVGSLTVRVVNTDGGISASVAVPIILDITPPAVTPPASILIKQTLCDPPGNAGATGNTSPQLSALINGGTGLDNCTVSPTRLSPQAEGQNVDDSSFFSGGATTITYRYQDNAGNTGTATATVTVLLYGDLDGNATLEAVDLVLLANYLVGNIREFTVPLTMADLNRDTQVNAVDMVILANYMVDNFDCLPRCTGPCPID